MDKMAKAGSGTHCIHGVLIGFPCEACHFVLPEQPQAKEVAASAPPGPRSRPSVLAERMRRTETPSSP